MNFLTVGAEDITLQAQFLHLGSTVPAPISWSSSNAGAATVSPAGDGYSAKVHAVAAGSTTITLSAGSMTATLDFKVTAAAAPRAAIMILSPFGQAFPNDTGGQEINPIPA